MAREHSAYDLVVREVLLQYQKNPKSWMFRNVQLKLNEVAVVANKPNGT